MAKLRKDEQSALLERYNDIVRARHGSLERLRALGLDDLLSDKGDVWDDKKQFMLDVHDREAVSLALKRNDLSLSQLKYAALANPERTRVISDILGHPNASPELLKWAYSIHADPKVDEAAHVLPWALADNPESYRHVTPEVLDLAIRHPMKHVRETAARYMPMDEDTIRRMYNDPSLVESIPNIHNALAYRENAPRDVIEQHLHTALDDMMLGKDTLKATRETMERRELGEYVVKDFREYLNQSHLDKALEQKNTHALSHFPEPTWDEERLSRFLTAPEYSFERKRLILNRLDNHSVPVRPGDILKAHEQARANMQYTEADSRFVLSSASFKLDPERVSDQDLEAFHGLNRFGVDLAIELDGKRQQPKYKDEDLARMLKERYKRPLDVGIDVFRHPNLGPNVKEYAKNNFGRLDSLVAEAAAEAMSTEDLKHLASTLEGTSLSMLTNILGYDRRNPRTMEIVEHMLRHKRSETVIAGLNAADGTRDKDLSQKIAGDRDLFDGILGHIQKDSLDAHVYRSKLAAVLARAWGHEDMTPDDHQMDWFIKHGRGRIENLPDSIATNVAKKAIDKGDTETLDNLSKWKPLRLDREYADKFVDSLVASGNDNTGLNDYRGMVAHFLDYSDFSDTSLKKLYSHFGDSGSVIQGVLQHRNCPEELHRDALNSNDYVIQRTALKHGHFSLEDLKALHVQHKDTALGKEIREMLSERDPDLAFEEQVGFTFDTGRARKLRDHILSRSPQTKTMHQKEVAKFMNGDWGKFRVDGGLISADKIQEYLDTAKHDLRYNVSHTTYGKAGWDHPYDDRDDGHYGPLPQQRHNDQPSQVFQVNLTTQMMNEIAKRGLSGAFGRAYEARFYAGHPIIRNRTLGWVRYTGKPENGLFIDEVQSDFGSGLRDSLKSKEITQEEHDQLSDILFGGRHPSIAINEAFHQYLRDQGHAGCKVAMHSVPVKAAISLRDYPGKPPPAHFIEGYEKTPKKLGMEPSTYSQENMPTQNNPKLQGKPTWQHVLRKFERGESMSDEEYAVLVAILES